MAGGVATPLAEVPFGEYAAIYDLIYRDKDYAAESAFVDSLIRLHRSPGAGRTVLDLACGTGRHLFELAGLGYDGEGSDISADMISVARDSARRRGMSMTFYNESFQSCGRIGRTYDVALALFASLGYLTAKGDVVNAFRDIRGLLAPGGLLVFDVWNGLAVVRDFTPRKIRKAEGQGLSVERVSLTELVEVAQVASVNCHFTVVRPGAVTRTFEELHRVRFFFPADLRDILHSTGFEVVGMCPFLEPNSPLSPQNWNMTFVARRVS